MAPSRAIQPLRSICASCARQQSLRRHYSATTAQRYASESQLPRVATPSFWASLIPKPFRRSPDQLPGSASRPSLTSRVFTRSRDWNPATIFILLGILVGSNAIQMITLRNEMLNFSRKTQAKLDLLREVVQRVKNGEDVDVKRALGTGDPKEEQEWEDVVKELETTDALWEGRKKREAKRVEKAEQRRINDEERRLAKQREGGTDVSEVEREGANTANERRPKFLM